MAKFEFIGLNGFESFCNIEIFLNHGYTVIVASEESSNTGTSVTNAIEKLIALVPEHYGIRLEDIVWIEHYSEDCHFVTEESFDIVHIHKTGEEVELPRWKRIDLGTYHQIVDGKMTEFDIQEYKLLQLEIF